MKLKEENENAMGAALDVQGCVTPLSALEKLSNYKSSHIIKG